MNGPGETKYILCALWSCRAGALSSEDLADGHSYGDVLVINPLK